jgi:hypothetical protein
MSLGDAGATVSALISLSLSSEGSGGRGHFSPRLPQIPLRGIPRNGMYVQRMVMLRAYPTR